MTYTGNTPNIPNNVFTNTGKTEKKDAKSFEANFFTGSDDVFSSIDQILSGGTSNTSSPLDDYIGTFEQIDKQLKEAAKLAEEAKAAEKLKQEQEAKAAAEKKEKEAAAKNSLKASDDVNIALKNNDNNTTINQIEKLSATERVEMEKAYAVKHGDGNPYALRRAIRDKLSSADEDKTIALLNKDIHKDPAMATVALAEAMDGGVKDFKSVNTIFSNANKAELETIENTFDKTMKKEGALKEWITNNFTGDHQALLLQKLN